MFLYHAQSSPFVVVPCLSTTSYEPLRSEAWVYRTFRVNISGHDGDVMRRSPSEDDIRTIYRASVDDLFDFVVRRCRGDLELAEDITQETWLRAVDDWDRNGLPEHPAAWLARVASRLLSNHRRHQDVERISNDDPDTVADETDRVERQHQRSIVQRALEKLPAAQARLLERFHFERRPVAEIAASAGLSERAVEGRLRRARARLRGLIGNELPRNDQ
jgi:RNA polymerase sigma-70 factor (ECF subfamily)